MDETCIARQLDIRHMVCPETFLAIEAALNEAAEGEGIEILLTGQGTAASLGQSLRLAGHTVLKAERLESDAFRLTVRKGKA